MTVQVRGALVSALLVATCGIAEADPTVIGVSLFANGGAVGGTQPDSVTTGNGSVWIEYGNNVDSTGIVPGYSTIVQYSTGGAVRRVYSISGEVDGLKVDPVTGMVWALQNQDANSTISLIDPSDGKIAGPLKYASPPYIYYTNPTLAADDGRGYDDIAFLGGKVYLSYTNPVKPSDPVLQILDNGDHPTGTLTTTSILTAAQTGIAVPDIDSLKSTPNGELVLTSEGDGPGTGNPVATFTLISNPGTANQKVTNVPVTDAKGNPVEDMDDVLFPDAASGTLYVASRDNDDVYAVRLAGLDPDVPIISLGSLDEVATVNPATGVVEKALLTGIEPAGLDFIAVPEPSSWAMILVGFAGIGYAGRRSARAAISIG